jgi:hypothetical protein
MTKAMAKTQNPKQPKPKACSMGAKMGRPESYDPHLADEIIQKIQSEPKGLKQLCAENEHWPHPATIYGWTYNYPKFFDLYWKAKVNQAHLYVDESFDLTNEVRGDKDMSQWLSTAIGLRKWYAARLVPRLYGEKMKLENLEEQNAEKDKEIAALKDHLKKYEREY